MRQTCLTYDVVVPAAKNAGQGSRLGITTSQLWIVVAVALPVIAVLLRRATSPDLAYQLRLGEFLLDSHSIPRVDAFTFTVTGRPWIDQQWGAQIVLASVFRWGGWAALGALRALLVGATAVLLVLACRASGVSNRAAALLTVTGSLVALPALTIRPQLLVVPLFAATLWIVATRHAHPGRLWALPGIVLVWANVHGSVVLVAVVLALCVVADIRTDRPMVRRLALVLGACVVAVFVNPFGFRLVEYVAQIATNDTIRDLITEWEPPTLGDPWGALFLVSGFSVAVYLARSDRPTPWPTVAWLGAFFVLGLTAYRSVLWWALAAPVAIASTMAPTDTSEVRRRSPQRSDDQRMLPNAVAAGGLLIAVLLLLPGAVRGGDAPFWLPKDAPLGLTERAREGLPPGTRTFVAQPWASWFELEAPHLPVFVDSRIELFPERVWEDYSLVVNGRDGWQDVLDRYGVDAVIEPREGSELLSRISDDPSWTTLAEDQDGVIFVRSSGGAEELGPG